MKSFISYILIIMAILFSVGSVSTAYASPTLSVNSTGDDVVILQQKLKDIGYMITMVDGEFGNETKAAVEQFQKDHNISVTGIVKLNHRKNLKLRPPSPIIPNLIASTIVTAS